MTKVNKVGKVESKRDESYEGTDVRITNLNGKKFGFFFYDNGTVLIYSHYDVKDVNFGFSKYIVFSHDEPVNSQFEGWSSPQIIIKE